MWWIGVNWKMLAQRLFLAGYTLTGVSGLSLLALNIAGQPIPPTDQAQEADQTQSTPDTKRNNIHIDESGHTPQETPTPTSIGFNKKISLMIKDPETGESKPIAEYLTGESLADLQSSSVQSWDSTKAIGEGKDIYQEVHGQKGPEAHGPIKSTRLLCPPNRCSINIAESEEAKNIQNILPIGSLSQATGQEVVYDIKSITSSALTVFYLNGHTDHLIPLGDNAGYAFLPDRWIINQPWLINGLDLTSVGQINDQGQRSQTFSVKSGKIGALLYEEKPTVVNTPNQIRQARYNPYH